MHNHPDPHLENYIINFSTPSWPSIIYSEAWKKKKINSLQYIAKKYNPQLTLTSDDIFQLQAVESSFAIDATPVQLFCQGVCEAVFHNSPHCVFDVNPTNDTQSNNLGGKKEHTWSIWAVLVVPQF